MILHLVWHRLVNAHPLLPLIKNRSVDSIGMLQCCLAIHPRHTRTSSLKLQCNREEGGVLRRRRNDVILYAFAVQLIYNQEGKLIAIHFAYCNEGRLQRTLEGETSAPGDVEKSLDADTKSIVFLYAYDLRD